MSYPPFGLTEADAETLIRLAAAAGDEKRLGATDPYGEALVAFSDTPDVDALAVRTWAAIEKEDA